MMLSTRTVDRRMFHCIAVATTLADQHSLVVLELILLRRTTQTVSLKKSKSHPKDSPKERKHG
jgi:hypothetical protein